jgi:cytidine deaminase
MMEREQKELLLKLAREARDHSYSPYSHYAVGAALLTKDGRIYQGCNIENASFTPTICAERTAFFKAIFDGVRDFAAIAVIGTGEMPAYPCGVCRQVMAEFCDGDFIIITSNRDGSEVVTETLDQMLPHRFGPKDLA